jgi:hypothetical protein
MLRDHSWIFRLLIQLILSAGKLHLHIMAISFIVITVLAIPNTNGFINDGKKIELGGELSKEKNYYQLRNGNKMLKIIELNADLVHLLDEDNSLLPGNAGWSYTLNSTSPLRSDQIYITAKQAHLKDSMASAMQISVTR